jgi:hypothetical protein
MEKISSSLRRHTHEQVFDPFSPPKRRIRGWPRVPGWSRGATGTQSWNEKQTRTVVMMAVGQYPNRL